MSINDYIVTNCLNTIEIRLDTIDNDKAKQKISEVISNFNKSSDSNEKLTIVGEALYEIANEFFIVNDLAHYVFYHVSDVIEKVLEELSKKS